MELATQASKVIQCGDSLGGQTVQSITYYQQISHAVSGQSVVVSASLGGATAIYRIDTSPPVQVTTANFVTKTVLDHTVEDEGTVFPQTFTLHNSGTTTWTNLQLVHVSDSDQLGAPTTPVSVPTTAPGQNAVVTVPLQATKSNSGSGATQLAYWELKDGDTVVPISGTIYSHSEATYAANKVWTMITIQPSPDPNYPQFTPNLRSAGYTDASINPYLRENKYGGQCTAFVWGRVYEKLGIQLQPPDQNGATYSWGYAGSSWIDYAKLAKYNFDTTSTAVPKDNSIAVWATYDANGNEVGGHVAYVEHVNDDGTVVINEANDGNAGSCYLSYASRNDPTGAHTWGGGYDGQPNTSLTVSGMRSRGTKTVYKLLGYIYLTN